MPNVLRSLEEALRRAGGPARSDEFVSMPVRRVALAGLLSRMKDCEAEHVLTGGGAPRLGLAEVCGEKIYMRRRPDGAPY